MLQPLLLAEQEAAEAKFFMYCQNVCKIAMLIVVIVFFTLSTYQYTPTWSVNNVSLSIMSVIRLQDSSSNQTGDVSPAIDEFWQFEPTVRLYDSRTDIATKYVLLWTPFFGDWSDHYNRNHGPFTELEIYNSPKRCFFTMDRRYLDNASALLLHGRDFDFDDLPPKRFPFQRWIFYLHESLVHSGFNDAQWQRANALQFNWTMTHAKAADVFFPFGHIRRLKAEPDLPALKSKIRRFAKSFKSRQTDAVWVVSNCYPPSMRDRFVEKLIQLGINVDIYGACGDKGRPDDEWKSKGETQFFSRYRFVFAFENSLCQDYITEKAFHAFYASYIAGSIPVVFGGGNYSDVFPNGSYIDMRSFKNITDLANLMRNLSQSDEKSLHLLSYYDWLITVNPAYSHDYELDKSSDRYLFDYPKRPGWRNLCRKLWDFDTGNNEDKKPFNSTLVPDIKVALGGCVSPDLSPLGNRFRRKPYNDDDCRNLRSFSYRGVNPNGAARFIKL